MIAVAVLPVISGLTGDAYLHAHRFADGFRVALIVCAIMCVAGGVLAAFTIKNTLVAADPVGAA